MGQQQLLLLVLGIVIVGIAVVAGIQAFSEGKDKASQDAAVSDAMRIISDTQAWMLKPSAFGGAAGKPTAVANLSNLGYKVAAGKSYATVNGCFKLAGTAASTALDIHRLKDDGTELPGELASCAGTKIATVTITGAKASDIAWAY